MVTEGEPGFEFVSTSIELRRGDRSGQNWQGLELATLPARTEATVPAEVLASALEPSRPGAIFRGRVAAGSPTTGSCTLVSGTGGCEIAGLAGLSSWAFVGVGVGYLCDNGEVIEQLSRLSIAASCLGIACHGFIRLPQ